MISFSPNSLSVSVLSNVCFMVLRAFEWIVWWLMAMVCGSLIMSSNPYEKLSRWVKRGISYLSPLTQWVKHGISCWSTSPSVKQLMLDFQNTSANEMTSLRNQMKTADRTSANEIATLRSEMNVIMEKIAFMEKIYDYEYTLQNPYEKGNHIPGKDMARLVELKVVLNKHWNINLFPGFSGWLENASEDELMDVAIAFIAGRAPCHFQLFEGVHLACTPDIKENDYRHLMKQLKDRRDSLINNHYYSYDIKKFTEARALRVENVLTKLREMNLLK